MTAINILPLEDVAYLFSDGAAYDYEGRLQSVSGKTHIMAGISTAILFSGRSILAPYIVHLLEGRARSFDHLYEILPDELEGMEDALTNLFGDDRRARNGAVQGYRMFVAGWSDKRRKMVTFCIASTADQSGLGAGRGAYCIIEGEGFQAPGVTDAQCMLGYGGRPSPTHENMEDVALTTLELQRQEPDEEGRYVVGGLVEFVTVRKDRIETKILKRWTEDQAGEFIKPSPVDWTAWRARRRSRAALATIPEGLSRLQRERMEKKLRKGTLRAV